MSTSTTSSPKTPSVIYYKEEDTGRIIEDTPFEKIVAVIAANGNIPDDAGESKQEIAKRLLMLQIRSHPKQAEVPAEFEEVDLSDANELAHQIANAHMECKAEIDEREKNAKQLKDEQKEAERIAKENQAKELEKNEKDFSDKFISMINKQAKNASEFVNKFTSTLKLPDTTKLTAGGMGVIIAKNATREDVATAVATAVTALGSLKNAQGAIQFIIGDALNASVANGTFLKKNDAANAVRLYVQEKCNVKYDIGHIQACALMAERIPAEKRMQGVKPAHYLAISKLTLPRSKDNKENTEEAQQDVENFRAELIEKVNSGEADGNKIVSEIERFKVEKGFTKPKTDLGQEIGSLAKSLFWADFMTEIASRDETITVNRGKDKHTYTLAELAEKKEQAFERLKDILLADYDIPSLAKGVREVEKNGKKEDAVYRLADPFWTPEKKKKEAKEEKAPESKEGEQEESEEAEDVGF